MTLPSSAIHDKYAPEYRRRKSKNYFV